MSAKDVFVLPMPGSATPSGCTVGLTPEPGSAALRPSIHHECHQRRRGGVLVLWTHKLGQNERSRCVGEGEVSQLQALQKKQGALSRDCALLDQLRVFSFHDAPPAHDLSFSVASERVVSRVVVLEPCRHSVFKSLCN